MLTVAACAAALTAHVTQLLAMTLGMLMIVPPSFLPPAAGSSPHLCQTHHHRDSGKTTLLQLSSQMAWASRYCLMLPKGDMLYCFQATAQADLMCMATEARALLHCHVILLQVLVLRIRA